MPDDLAADSLDLLGVVLGAEAEFEVSIPEAALAAVRTYGDLVRTVAALVARRQLEPAARAPAVVRTRLVPGEAGDRGWVGRAEWLTPYAAQTIAEDALYAGRGSRLEVEMPSSSSDAELAQVAERFARLPPRGVDVQVRRSGSTMGWSGGPVRRTGS
jgi:hypothetical protein